MLAVLDTSQDAIPRQGIRVSADPVQPQEAIDHFRSKSPLDKAAWLKLSAEAKKRAFTAAWVTDVNVLQSVKDSLDKAIAEGQSFESWKSSIRAELGERWNRSNEYLETVFRNNVQTAYAAGRYQASTTPMVLQLRPFWRLVVLLDDGTSPYCRPLAQPPVVLPADDPWWAYNCPPRHHRCRTTVVTLSRRQAERLGVLKTAPSVATQDGWGSTAGLGTWQPAGDRIHPIIFKPAEMAAAAAPPPIAGAPAVPAAVNRGGYADHYRKIAAGLTDGDLRYQRDRSSLRDESFAVVRGVYRDTIAAGKTPTEIATSVLDPIKISIFADGTMSITDGRHRYLVAREYGATAIAADVTQYGPQGGVRWEQVMIVPLLEATQAQP